MERDLLIHHSYLKVYFIPKHLAKNMQSLLHLVEKGHIQLDAFQV